jgi:hypothetical protein
MRRVYLRMKMEEDRIQRGGLKNAITAEADEDC